MALATAMACSVQAGAQTNPARSSSSGENDPIVIEAERLSGRPDVDAQAEGKVELRRGSLVLRADRVDYRQADGIAKALGNVQVESEGARFTGPELQLQLERFEGYFLEPTYFFSQLQAGGQARRFDFIDRDHGVALDATYTSCTPEDPAWVLSARRVSVDMAKEEGRAEGGVLRFYGVPILAAPDFTFPLSDARKSGWLPPNFNLDNNSGLDLSVPYYWNIAPNMDATVVPTVMSRRGVGAAGEFRYLQPRYEGEWRGHFMPNDREANRTRWSLDLNHESRLTTPYVGGDADVGFAVQRASDDDYWKDFSRTLPSDTQRLLPGEAHALRRFDNGWGDTWTYANVQTWQVLQDEESPILTPYRRLPQVGVRQRGALAGFEWDWQTEANRFSRVTTRFVDDDRFDDGTRVHALGRLARPFYPLGTPSWTITPRVALNAATYDLDEPMEDGRRSASRVIPTVSLDSGWVLERETRAFGRELTQTLEPRLLYVNTPYKRQSILPNFDSAAKDLNFTSIFADNDFSGIDRVSDANQFTGGVTTRFLDRQTGAELLRLGIVQRLLLRDQRITEDDGPPITQRWSDMLLLGSTNLVPRWWLDASVQYSPEIGRAVRSIVNARYSPGPFRTVNMTYRYSRDDNEQIEFGWQWPLNEPARLHAVAAQAREAQARDGMGLLGARAQPVGSSCGGAWYGVGRVSYNRRDSRLTDSILGVEYDSGCWIGRIVAERLSTGRSEATTRLLLQLELVGLSRLGSNPLGVLRDNIPGYRLLRDDPNAPAPGAYATPMSSSR